MANASVQLELNVNVTIHKEIIATGEVSTEEYHNLAVDDGLNLLRDFLNGDAVTGLNMFALGTGTNAVTNADHTLQTEVFRDQFTQLSKPGTGQLQIKYYLSSTSANGNTLSEAGVFGNGATSAANSGIMAARVTFPGDAKTSAQAWTFIWTFSLTATS